MVLTGLVALGIYLIGFQDRSAVSVLGALVTGYAIFRVGFAILGSFARPVPAAPPAGELRRVKIGFRCSICGTEVRMTTANDEIPEPPRHCLEDMELVTPVDE